VGGIHHKICHVLGGAYDLPHAETHTVVLPHAVAFNAPAVPEVMERVVRALGETGFYMDDVGLVELNEAFAAQVLACLHEWGMDADDERLNPNGGSIALGHPLGASGARILTTLVHEMVGREDVRYGLATMCIGVGQGIAMVVERVN
jgi:acetyl-CoA acetyltransferase